MSTTPRILVVGSINIDLVVEVARLPREGETLVGRSMTRIPGGKGANQAVAAARLGAAAIFCGRIGDDDDGRFVAAKLREAGVDAGGLVIDPRRATGTAIILVEPSGKNQIIAVGGANLGVVPGDVDGAIALASRSGKLDAMLFTLETPLKTVRHMMARANELKIPAILDAAPPADYPLNLLQGLTVISPNETEAQSLTGIAIVTLEDAGRAAAKLFEGTGAKHVVIKLGERGCLLHDADCTRHIEPVKVNAIDTTAAGDAFTAALAVRLCKGDAMLDALRYANTAGALATTKLGAQPSLPTAAEVAVFAG